MVYEKRLKLFQSLVTTAGFAAFVSFAYRFYGGNDFGEVTPDIILFSSYLAFALSLFVLALIDFPFVKFSKEVYSLAVNGVESSAIRNSFRLLNCCFAVYCSIQASSIIGSVFHVSWTSMPFSAVFLTFCIFAPFYILLASGLSTVTFYRRHDSLAVKEAYQPKNGMHNCAPVVLIAVLGIMCHCWIITFNTFGKNVLENFAYSYDFQSHSCINVKESNVVYLSSSHARVLVKKNKDAKSVYVILSCMVGR